MKLDELIEHLDYKDLINFKNVEISGISYNSKTTKKGLANVKPVLFCPLCDLINRLTFFF